MLRVLTTDVNSAPPAACLGYFDYGVADRSDNTPGQADLRRIEVAMNPLSQAQREIWLGNGPVKCGEQNGFRFTHDKNWLMASRLLPADALSDLARTTRSVYVHLDAFLRRMGYPHWVRVWNYIPDITVGADDEERYRQFNAGRHAAVALKTEFENNLPAASGVGSLRGGLVIACLAGKQADHVDAQAVGAGITGIPLQGSGKVICLEDFQKLIVKVVVPT